MSAECNKCGHDLVRTIDSNFHCLNCENAQLRIMAESRTQILKKVLDHLDNGATSANEALCLIRRDVETALQTKDT